MLYHVTKWRRVPSIKKQGLVRGKRPMWRNTLGAVLGLRSALYLCSTEDSAIRLAGRLEWGLISRNLVDTRVAILDIDPEGIVTEPDLQWEGGMYGWVLTREDIPATAIKRVRMLTPEMLRDFIARANRSKG